MDHLALLDAADETAINGKNLRQRATGRFFTHELIGRRLAKSAAELMGRRSNLRIIDPFGGDGRLIVWMLEALAGSSVRRVSAAIWEQDPSLEPGSKERVTALATELGLELELEIWTGDTFERAVSCPDRFDIVITNPPWELLKPDHRELARLPSEIRDRYIAELKAVDKRLAHDFPTSQPSRRFAGWGTNLSRVGTEVALRLTAAGGVAGVVAPSSLLADSTTAELRRWMLEDFALVDVTHWPAEARLFESVDVPCISFSAVREPAPRPTCFLRVGADRTVLDQDEVVLDKAWLKERDYAIPVAYGADGVRLLRKLQDHPTFRDLEGKGPAGLWAGRELDETRRGDFTGPIGSRPFVRSRHIRRLEDPLLPDNEFLDETKRQVPSSADFIRLVWRDISRPSQTRRIHATILKSGPVAGNSLGVAYFRDGDPQKLLALLGIISSIPFEFQVRSRLMTNHVSLSVMRSTHLPQLTEPLISRLSDATALCLSGSPNAEERLERLVAESYGLSLDSWSEFVSHFDIDAERIAAFRSAWSQ